MPRFKTRMVEVDMGYDLQENIILCKAVAEREVEQLFSKTKTINLLVELPGGERRWVNRWKENQ